MKFETILNKNIYLGIDELEIYISKKDILFFEKLNYLGIDEDNSNFSEIILSDYIFHITKIKPAGFEFGYKFQTIIDNKIIECFSINFSLINDKKNVLVLYSAITHLNNIGKFDLLNFLNQNFKLNLNYRRFDIALDLPFEKGYFLKYFKPFKSKIKYVKKLNEYETYYTRSVKNSENSDFLIRIYDKNKDTFKKGKGFLYNHLKKNTNRIELEIRTQQAKKFKLSLNDILNNKYILKKIFIGYLNKDLVKPLQNDFIIPKNDNKKFDLEKQFFKLGYIPDTYISRASGYAKNIYNQTGFKGYVQFILGIEYNNENKRIDTGLSKIKYQSFLKPLDLWIHLGKFIIRNNLVSQNNINNAFKKEIFKIPKIKK